MHLAQARSSPARACHVTSSERKGRTLRGGREQYCGYCSHASAQIGGRNLTPDQPAPNLHHLNFVPFVQERA